LEEKITIFGILGILILMYKVTHYFSFLLIFLSLGWSYGQDLDIYKHQKNSNFEIPDIPKEMTYKEFKILSTDLRMQDMVIAAILPGHVHFKIGEKKTGYYILGARSLGYLGLIYLSAVDKSWSKIILLDNIGLDQSISTGDIIVTYGSLMLILGSYLYDWIHGKYVLDDKQNRIRYKYAQKKLQLSFNLIRSARFQYPAVGLIYNF